EFYNNPSHIYTKFLLESVPTLEEDKKLKSIPGSPPSLINLPQGCRFSPRCPFVMDICKEKEPPIFKVSNTHLVRCYLAKGEKDAR
ncbi:MAG: oligopeptide/dipeptide ABC transporter ATP-binding protein, partial [bacterium]